MGCIQSTTSATDDVEEAFSPMLPESVRNVNSFYTAASEFLDGNSDALDNISKLQDKISSNPNLVDFMTEHLKNSMDTIRFFTAFKHSLQKAREAELLIRQAVVLFNDCHDHKATLEKLWQFKEEGNPFTEKFIEEFKLMIERQNSILQDLRHRIEELDRKLNNSKAWRKVWKIVYYAAFAVVLIIVWVLAVLGVPPGVIATFTATSNGMPPLKELANWIRDKFRSPLEGERDVIDRIWKGTKFAIEELNNIKALVEELKIKKIKSTVHIEFAIEEKEEAALKIAMVAIKFMAKTFSKSVEDVEKDVDQRVTELKKTTVSILETFPDSLKKMKKKKRDLGNSMLSAHLVPELGKLEHLRYLNSLLRFRTQLLTLP